MTKAPSFDQPEIIMTESPKVSCDGGGGALGHPIVWYEMGDDDMVECKYCDRRFILRGGKADPDQK
ncbi:MAG: zinc-finger domain-containing protein [Hyphomonadaceae bacterium]|nr:zinc-finger domain-containing protein [Hyphomonadaceae bacterium]